MEGCYSDVKLHYLLGMLYIFPGITIDGVRDNLSGMFITSLTFIQKSLFHFLFMSHPCVGSLLIYVFLQTLQSITL